MSAITHVRFYPSDWLTGTRGMTASQMGVYITLIAMMYERCGPISCADMAKLARLCGTSASAFKGLLDDLISDGKIQRNGDMISNRRAMLEIENVMAKSGVARDKANSRWTKNAEKSKADECSGNAEAMLVSSHKSVDSNISSLRSEIERAEAPPLAKPKNEKRAHRLPEDFAPGDAGKASAQKAGMSPSVMMEQLERFRDYHVSKGSKMVDWQAAWRTWCGNYRPRGSPPPRRESAETILGRIARGEPENGNSNGTVIEGRFAREDQGNGSQGVPLLPDLWPPARNL